MERNKKYFVVNQHKGYELFERQAKDILNDYNRHLSGRGKNITRSRFGANYYDELIERFLNDPDSWHLFESREEAEKFVKEQTQD
jgi:hypothetical protein